MGICIGSAVVPIAMVVLSPNLGPNTAIIAAITGFVCAVIAWLSQAAAQGGGISIVGGDGGENANTLGSDYERRPEFLLEARAWIMKYGVTWTAFLTIGWPTLSIPFGVFGKSTYQLWSSIALCWGWTAGITIIALPIIENLKTICRVVTCNPMSAEEVTCNPMSA